MKPAPFRYHAPRTLAEAVDMLGEVASEDGRVLAGGQSLVPIMAFRLARPAHLGERIDTLEGPAVAEAGEWLVEGDLHERWLVSGARFAAAYEAV